MQGIDDLHLARDRIEEAVDRLAVLVDPAPRPSLLWGGIQRLTLQHAIVCVRRGSSDAHRRPRGEHCSCLGEDGGHGFGPPGLQGAEGEQCALDETAADGNGEGAGSPGGAASR